MFQVGFRTFSRSGHDYAGNKIHGETLQQGFEQANVQGREKEDHMVAVCRRIAGVARCNVFL